MIRRKDCARRTPPAAEYYLLRSRQFSIYFTVIETLALLLAVLLSLVIVLILATLVRVPRKRACRTTVTVALAPLFSVLSRQVTVVVP